MSKYIVQAKDSNDSVVITPARKPAAPVVIKDEDEGKPVTFGGGRVIKVIKVIRPGYRDSGGHYSGGDTV